MTIDIEKLINDIDEDGSGEIEYDEFRNLLSSSDWKCSNQLNCKITHGTPALHESLQGIYNVPLGVLPCTEENKFPRSNYSN